jgi:hypothetical protein
MRHACFSAATLLTISSVVLAAPAASEAERSATVAEARQALERQYVVPELAPRLSRALEEAERAGRYRGLSGDALAERMTADLRAVTKDKHLGIRYAPQQAAELRSAQPDRPAELPASYVREVERLNAGVRRLELLPGNIRYMAYDGFYWGTPGAEAALATAMRFLRDGDAIIIDLRANGGGWPAAVSALSGYFLPAGTPLVRFEMRDAPGEASQSQPAPFSLAGKPTFVLVGDGTASAAEEFASHADAFGFGTLIGQSTAGAAYRNTFVPLSGGYVLSVSVGRPVHARTGGDWEGRGVAPRIVVPVEQALVRAQQEAMSTVAATLNGAERRTAERLLTYYRALNQPVRPARSWADYAGRYGDRVITAEENGLVLRRQAGSASALVPLGGDRFAMNRDPTTQVSFVARGSALIAMNVESGTGSVNRLKRTR